VDLGSQPKSEPLGLGLVNETPAYLIWIEEVWLERGTLKLKGWEVEDERRRGESWGGPKKNEIELLWLDLGLVWPADVPCEVIGAPYVVT
jgi:hypothetical protein